MGSLVRNRAFLLLGLIVLSVGTQVVFVSSAQWGLPLDDGWTHATYARNLALHGQLCLNPGEPSTGTTSFLWTGLLAAAYLVLHNPIASAILMGLGLQAWLAVIIFQLVRDAKGADGRSLLAAVSCALLGPLVWLSLSGMENTLFLALALTAIRCRCRGRLGTAGILAGLLVLTRPEGLALALLMALPECLALWRGWRGAGRLPMEDWRWEMGPEARPQDPPPPGPSPIRNLLCLVLPVAVAAALYAAINLAITGHLLTSTYAGRRWLYGQPERLDLGPLAVGGGLLALARSWAQYLYRWVFGTMLLTWLDAPAPEIIGGVATLLMELIALLGVAVLWQYARPPGAPANGCRSPLRLLLAWVPVHNVAYAVMLPHHGHAGRYQAANFILLALLVTLGAVRLTLARGRVRQIGIAALALWLALCVGGAALWRQMFCDAVGHINGTHVACARWIAANLPRDAVVATFDLGAISYFSERRVVDIGGLVDPEMTRQLFAGDIVPYLRRKQVTHLALVLHNRSDTELAERLGLLPERPGDRPRLILCAPLWSISPEHYHLHHAATSNAMRIMALYRLEWPAR